MGQGFIKWEAKWGEYTEEGYTREGHIGGRHIREGHMYMYRRTTCGRRIVGKKDRYRKETYGGRIGTYE